MDPSTRDRLLTELHELAAELELTVRQAPLGGEGATLAEVRGRSIVFVDTEADAEDQLLALARVIGGLSAAGEHYVSPALRELMAERGEEWL